MKARIRKLATGLSSRQTADAFARKYSDPPPALSDDEHAQADEFEATIESMFLMAAVDGEISSEEMGQLAASIEAVVAVQGTHERVEVNKTLARLNAKLAKDGWKSRLDAVAGRLGTREARSFAFRLAAGVAFVDDHVAHAEAAAIEAFASALRISPDESQEILDDVQETLFR